MPPPVGIALYWGRPHTSCLELFCSAHLPFLSHHRAPTLHLQKTRAFQLGKTLSSGKFLLAFVQFWSSLTVHVLKTRGRCDRKYWHFSVTRHAITGTYMVIKFLENELIFSLPLFMMDSPLPSIAPVMHTAKHSLFPWISLIQVLCIFNSLMFSLNYDFISCPVCSCCYDGKLERQPHWEVIISQFAIHLVHFHSADLSFPVKQLPSTTQKDVPIKE